MNPLNLISIEELSNAELAALVRSRFGALSKLDPNETQRKELLRSGITAHTVAALYPFDFPSMTERLADVLTKQSLAHIVSSNMLNSMVDETSRISGQLFAQHMAMIDPEEPSMAFANAIDALEAHVHAQLSQEAELRRDHTKSGATTARTLVVLIWYALGYVALLDQIAPVGERGDIRRRILEHFCHVTDLAFPYFKVHEDAQRMRIDSYRAWNQ